MHLFGDSAVQPAAPGSEPVAGESGQQFDVFRFSRGQRGDAAVAEIGPVVEGSGIAEIVRQFEFGGETDALPVVEGRNGVAGGGAGRVRAPFSRRVDYARAVNAEVNSGMNVGDFTGCSLDLLGFDIDRLANLAERPRLRSAIADDTRGDVEFLTVSRRLDGRIEASRGSSHLNVKSAEEKK